MDHNVWISKKKKLAVCISRGRIYRAGQFPAWLWFWYDLPESFTGNMIQSTKYENSGCESVGDQND